MRLDPTQLVTSSPSGIPIPCAIELTDFAEAVAIGEDAALSRARRRLSEAMGDEAVVRAGAVIAAFHTLDRVADATGIQLDFPISLASQDLRESMRLDQYPSASNTPDSPIRRFAARLSRPLVAMALRRWFRSNRG